MDQTTTPNGSLPDTGDLPPLAAAIVRTVAYVDVFDYPLTAGEIHRYLVEYASPPEAVNAALADGRLVPRYLDYYNGFYALAGRADIVATRRRRAASARRLWPDARRYGRLLARLPFIRLVAVTGSLAVDNSDRHADIDYLLVTANGRVWLARALAIAIVRLAERAGLTLCPNYILAERALSFDDRNLYTAREIAQMVPLAGFETYRRLRSANAWTHHFLPNAGNAPPAHAGADALPRPRRRWSERLLNGAIGDRLDTWEMQRKIRKFNAQLHVNGHEGGVEAAFSPDWCKGHFHDHARRILATYDDTLKTLSDSAGRSSAEANTS